MVGLPVLAEHCHLVVLALSFARTTSVVAPVTLSQHDRSRRFTIMTIRVCEALDDFRYLQYATRPDDSARAAIS